MGTHNGRHCHHWFSSPYGGNGPRPCPGCRRTGNHHGGVHHRRHFRLIDLGFPHRQARSQMGNGHRRHCVSHGPTSSTDIGSRIRFTIGAVIIAASYSVPQMVFGRLVLGLGVGGTAVIGPLYISELAPTDVRGRCVGVNCSFIPFGQVVASAAPDSKQALLPTSPGVHSVGAVGKNRPPS
jgi:hypothetical protein